MDICLYISDQHSCQRQGYAGDPVIRTPNLDRIRREGAAVTNCYCSHPVCVPSRMSMLSGIHSSKNGSMSNHSALDSNRATFVHCLCAAGYETVLCGRMHFVGPDQRHGFTRRIAGDITQIYHNRPASIAGERGVHNLTPQGGASSVSIIGGGNSPSLEYDRYVVRTALDYLQQDHEQPQFLCVGTYAPHHPYVAPNELYEYYYDKVDVPAESFSYPSHPVKELVFEDTDPEVVRAVRAAYCGMVEFEDQLIGQVYDAFNAYLERNHREGMFLYVSDHGEMEGYRGRYGKNVFYEPSAHVPMLWAGCGIAKGREIAHPASLLDVGPTLIELAQAPALPDADGVSLLAELQGAAPGDAERMVCCETGGEYNGKNFVYGQMCRYRNFKFIHYYGYDADDVLYDLENDPQESVNVLAQHPGVAAKMRAFIQGKLTVPPQQIAQKAAYDRASLAILKKCDLDSDERWHVPECARHYPQHMVSSKITVQDWIRQLKQKQG